jgi:hypothetical protein
MQTSLAVLLDDEPSSSIRKSSRPVQRVEARGHALVLLAQSDARRATPRAKAADTSASRSTSVSSARRSSAIPSCALPDLRTCFGSEGLVEARRLAYSGSALDPTWPNLARHSGGTGPRSRRNCDEQGRKAGIRVGGDQDVAASRSASAISWMTRARPPMARREG